MIHCQRCGTELSPGSLKFLITIHVTADFDGILPAEGNLEDLEAFMQQLDAQDPVSLANDVYQAQGYVLCPGCKRTFLADPLGLAREGEAAGEGGRVH